ncbi:MAG: acyltransferase [Acetobacteraceae bacterium]|nr:acyltransferase [Acetobacteraceae bacterium]
MSSPAPHPSPDPGGPGRSRALDGLRGLAAAAVVVYHSILHNDLSLIPRVLYQPLQAMPTLRDAVTKLFLIVCNGEVAVYVFFVLSGCVLRISLQRQARESAVRLCAGFALARAVRLYPPVITCMVLFYGLSQFGIPGLIRFTPWQLLQNASLWAITMHGPSYTIQVELLAVPFILAAWLLRRRFGFPALGLCVVYGVLAHDARWMTFFLPNMQSYLLAFVAGMIAAEPKLRSLLAETPGGAWWGAFAGLVFCRTFAPPEQSTSLIAMVLAAALLVAGLLHGRRGSLHRMLERPAIQALGRVSFSLYLLNVPVLYALWGWTDGRPWVARHALEAGLAVALVSFAITYPLAWASERWVERPAVIAGRWLGDRVRAGGRRRGLPTPLRGIGAE